MSDVFDDDIYTRLRNGELWSTFARHEAMAATMIEPSLRRLRSEGYRISKVYSSAGHLNDTVVWRAVVPEPPGGEGATYPLYLTRERLTLVSLLIRHGRAGLLSALEAGRLGADDGAVAFAQIKGLQQQVHDLLDCLSERAGAAALVRREGGG